MNKDKLYLVYGEYFATGEGIHEWVTTNFATTPTKAVQCALDKFGASNYFRPAFKALEVNSKNKKKIKQVLECFFSQRLVDSLMSESRYGGYLWNGAGEFKFSSDVNWS